MPMSGLSDGPAIERLGVDECWRVLGNHEFGHLCFCVDERVQVVLTSYAVLSDRIYFRAGAFGPVARRVLTRPVTFQVDDQQSNQRAGWTVTATGPARHVDDAATLAALWTPRRPPLTTVGQDSLWIELDPDDVHGQRLRG